MAAQVTTKTPKPQEPKVNTLREKGRPSFQHLYTDLNGPYQCLWSVYYTKTYKSHVDIALSQVETQ